MRFPEHPIKYYEPSVLRDLGQIIGPILRIDTRTTSESRWRFARICVQVNFANPLIKIIKVGGVKHPIQYKGINCLCFSCSRVGHKMESCPYTARATEKDGEDRTKMTDLPVVNRSVPSEETFGPWFMVSGKRQASRKGNKFSPQVSQHSPAQHQKVRSPNHVASPSTHELDPLGPLQKKSKHVASLFSTDNAFVANRTQLENKDRNYFYSAQTSTKHHSRNSRSNQKLRGASSLKGERLKQLAEVKESK